MDQDGGVEKTPLRPTPSRGEPSRRGDGALFIVMGLGSGQRSQLPHGPARKPLGWLMSHDGARLKREEAESDASDSAGTRRRGESIAGAGTTAWRP